MKKKAMQRRCRKILTILCFTFLCIIGISVHVQADTDIGVSELTEDERYNSEYYKPITKRAKTRAASMDSFENKIVTALQKFEKTIDISEYGLSEEKELQTAYYQILNDHAELFYVTSKFRYSYNQTGILSIVPEYNMTDKQQIEAIQNKMEAAVSEALSLVSNDMEDYEKALAVHDWLVKYCEYDYENYLKDPNQIPPKSHTARGALVDKVAVCDGYAKAYSYIMQTKLGITCGIVSSDSMNHAWNMIQIGNHYYHVDVTWDDPTWDCIGRVQHTYFLLSDQTIQIKKTQHTGWETSGVAGDTSYENGLWGSTESGVVYYSGNWYFVDNAARKIKKTTNILNGSPEECYSFKEFWETSSSSYYEKAYSYLWLYQNKLYFNDAKKIYSMSFATDKTTAIYEPSGLSVGTNIYGFKLEDGVLKYALQTVPVLQESQSKYIHTAPLPGVPPCTNHEWDDGTVTKEATCFQEGVKTFTCMQCSASKTETIPKTNEHKSTEIRNRKEATCKEAGYSGDTYCKDCGTQLKKGAIIPATSEHEWEDGIIIKEATCSMTGIKQLICKHCNTAKEEETPLTEHKNTEIRDQKDATCKETGYTGDTYCKDCNTKLETGKMIPVSNVHSWDNGSVIMPVTCLLEGEKEFTCVLCGEKKTETILATGHRNTEIRNKEEATCKEEGYSGDTYCKDCGTIVEKGEVVPATGKHVWDNGVIIKEATNSEKGTRIRTCSQCGESKTEEIPAIGSAPAPKKGTVLKSGNYSYRVTKSSAKNGIVEFYKAGGNAKSLTIPSTVTINGITYKVTSVRAKAFKNNKKINSVTFGSNITTIGKEAFSGCKFLKKITIKSTKLTSVGKNALKNIHKKAVIKCPSKKLKKYKTLFKAKTGFKKKTMKIKK